MIKVINKNDCCGCNACEAACPKKCITMIEDEEGFFYPLADNEKCINCGACERVCPILHNKNNTESFDKSAYILQNKDVDVLRDSTSGGAFTEIARYVLSHNGIVFGVELTQDFIVRHCYVDEEKELFRFRNSKYVQSYLGSDIYRQVKDFLQQGRYVCFSGTPCQIAGLKNFLRKDYDKLITVDVVCRAVPSPGIWKKYIEMEKEKIGKIKSIRFRDKTLGYQFSTMVIEGENDQKNRGGIETQPWLRMFFSGMIIRPSCTKCRFRSINRMSDFTIWDCFNSFRLDRNFNERKGATRMLVHTSKGAEIFELIKERFAYSEINVLDAIKGVKELKQSPKANAKRSEFFEDCQNNDLSMVVEKYFPITIILQLKAIGRFLLNKLKLDVIIKRIIKK